MPGSGGMNVEVLAARNLDGELIPGGNVFLTISYFTVINIETKDLKTYYASQLTHSRMFLENAWAEFCEYW